jgi:isoleucyl-tRNA synthetase
LAKVRVNVGSQKEREAILELADVLAEEINVKEIDVVAEVGELVDYKILPNNRLLGPRFGADFPRVRRALMALDATKAVSRLQEKGELALDLDGETVTLDEEDVLVQTESRGGLAVASDKGVTVAVDTTLTPALVQEGFARDLVRAVNNMRKEAGLEIEDRIHVTYAPPTDGDVADALQNYADYLQQEVLALSLVEVSDPHGDFAETVGVGDDNIKIAIRKA